MRILCKITHCLWYLLLLLITFATATQSMMVKITQETHQIKRYHVAGVFTTDNLLYRVSSCNLLSVKTFALNCLFKRYSVTSREYEIRELIHVVGFYTHQGIFHSIFELKLFRERNVIGQIAGGAVASSKHLKTKVQRFLTSSKNSTTSRAHDRIRG